MKRLVKSQMYNSIHDSEYQGWSYGIRNTGKNLGTGQIMCDYYVIPNDAHLEGL